MLYNEGGEQSGDTLCCNGGRHVQVSWCEISRKVNDKISANIRYTDLTVGRVDYCGEEFPELRQVPEAGGELVHVQHLHNQHHCYPDRYLSAKFCRDSFLLIVLIVCFHKLHLM